MGFRRCAPPAATITSIPFWDVAAAAKEVRRCAAKGHKGILFTGEPQYYDLPLLGDKHWNPLWEAAVELDLPISFHIGSGDMAEGLLKNKVATYGKMAAFTELAVDIFRHATGWQLTDLIMSGVLARHPRIKFVSVESGIGWVPFMLEALDYQFKGSSVAAGASGIKILNAVRILRAQRLCCYWFERDCCAACSTRSEWITSSSKPTFRIRPRSTATKCTLGSRAVFLTM